MATKSIVTRIKNKVDTLAKWQSYTGTLLDGEIAVVRVPTGSTYTNPVTGADEPVVELLMKVGDGTTAFASLPWMSAKASDVYDWAKAATVEFNGTDNKIYFKDAGGVAVANVDLSALNAKISALDSGKLSDITVSQSGSGVVKSVEKDGTGKVKVTRATVATGEIADSAITTAKIAASNVTTAKIADGAVTNAKLGTDISSDKINIGTGTTDGTLSKKLSTMDAAIAANTGKLTGHTDAAINTLIDNKINALDGGTNTGTAGDGKYVSKVVQTNGKVATTYASFPTAGTTAGIVKLGVTGGAATYDAVSTLSTQVETNKSDIATLKTSVAGGVHFRGTVSSEPSASTTVVNNVTIAVGDVVIYGGKEYICTAVTSGAPSWEQLGDVTRIGNLETKINDLDVTTSNDVTSTHKFVSQVKQSDGKVEVTYARPTASDISYGSSSDVNTKLGSIDAEIAKKANSADVYTKGQTDNAISTAIGNLAFTAPTASGNTTSFIDSVSQTDGKITATKKTITSASTSAKGIVQLSSAVDSTSEALAATPKAVKTAYDLAAGAKADAASKVASVSLAGGTNNGTLKLTVNGTATDNIAVTGLGSAAYTASTAYAPKAHASSATTYGAGSNSNYGHVKLSDSTSSTSGVSGGIAATPAAVKAAYDKGADGVAAAAAIASNYVKITNDNLVNQAGDVIIFDCGGAD